MPRRPAGPLNSSTAQFVERVALFFDAEGFSRTAGRIFGRLLLSEAARSLDDLAADLGASKASISTETRLLERRGILERVGRPGDRRVYYQVAPDLPVPTMEIRLDRMRRFSRVIEEAPPDVARGQPLVRARLDEVIEAYAYLLAAFGDALDRWRGAVRRGARPRKPVTPSR